MATWGNGDADKDKMLTDIVDDQIDVTGRAFMALTLACARCHDHKFDPIPTEDYYGLAGVFASTRMFNRRLKADAKKGDSEAEEPEAALHIVCEGRPIDLPVHLRGDPENPGPLVPRRFLRV